MADVVPAWTVVPTWRGDGPSPGPDMVETDRIYFELAATLVPLPGATLAYLAGLTSLPAAGVVHRVRPEAIAHPADWPAVVADAQRSVGMRLGRVYLDAPAPELEAALATAGWVARDELGYVARRGIPGDHASTIERRSVVDEADWGAKEALHAACDAGPDGHDAPGATWVAMERARCATGGLTMNLGRRDGVVVATGGAMQYGAVVRNKNLVVHPAHRRSTVGLAMLSHLAIDARPAGRYVGTFAVAGETGEQLYLAAGMEPVIVQREWSRPL